MVSDSDTGQDVLTSLSYRQVAIIHVEERDFMMEPITLKTVRPFVMDDIDLDEAIERASVKIEEKQAVIKVLKKKVAELIARADREWHEKYDALPAAERPEKMLPLVRLRVAYTRHETGNIIRFGQDFVDKVANPRDLLQFHKKKGSQVNKKNANLKEHYTEPTDEMLPAERLEKVHMSDLVQKYLSSQSLQILNPAGLERAVMNFVDKDDRDAIGHFVEKEMKTTNTGLVAINPDEAKLQAELDRIREEKMRLEEGDEEDEEEDDRSAAQKSTASKAASKRTQQIDSDDSMLDDMGGDDDEDAFEERQPSRASKAPVSKASSRATQASQRSSNGAKMTQSTLMFRTNSDEEGEEEASPPPPPKKATTSSRAAALSAMGAKSKTPARKAATASTRATGGRAAAKKASARLVESDGEDRQNDDEEASIVISDSGDEFESTSKKPAKGRGKR